MNEENVPPLEIVRCSEMGKQILGLYEQGLLPGDSSGWPSLDPYYTVEPGQWTLVTGVPSHGKSTWLDCLSINLANAGWYFAVCSPEQQPTELHMSLMAEKVSQKPFRKGFNGRIGKPELSMAIKFLDDHYRFLVSPEDSLTIPSILDIYGFASRAFNQWRDEGIRGKFGLIIDPWTELSHDYQGESTETKYIRETLTMLRMYARSMGCHIFLVAHPKMLSKHPKTGLYPIPTAYDISGSAHWYNKGDNIISVWRPEDGDLTEIHIQKVRFRHIGKRGMVQLRFNVASGTYTDLTATRRIFAGPTHLTSTSRDDF